MRLAVLFVWLRDFLLLGLYRTEGQLSLQFEALDALAELLNSSCGFLFSACNNPYSFLFSLLLKFYVVTGMVVQFITSHKCSRNRLKFRRLWKNLWTNSGLTSFHYIMLNSFFFMLHTLRLVKLTNKKNFTSERISKIDHKIPLRTFFSAIADIGLLSGSAHCIYVHFVALRMWGWAVFSCALPLQSNHTFSKAR